MIDTKEKILLTALRLFARDGYEAVSVSTIAGELGMTKGALYKHYKNKRDIFDSIVERMHRIDAERSAQYDVPADTYDADTEAYKSVAWDSIRSFSTAQFVFWTEDDFARSFRRMLTLEQYRNPEMAELYHSCIVDGPVDYMRSIFGEMTASGVLTDVDPELLALEFYSPMFLLIGASDIKQDRKKHLDMLNRHMEQFISCYGRKEN
ncbi:MAG TPA: TetR/AcrR family transcriptional regulator [Clostridiales bacterium]|nr:TetR/AcrR family transcriptional regulator [Clostridiales bacterium]